MPREGEPRVMVRLSEADAAVIEAAAMSAGVAVGALMRECAVRYAAQVAGDVAAGRIQLRRRSGASSEVEKPEPAVAPARAAPVMPPAGEGRAEMFRRLSQRP